MGSIMPSKKLENNYSLQNIAHEYKLLRNHYDESVKKLSRDFDILKHSKANTNYEAQNSGSQYQGEKDEILEISQDIIRLERAYDLLNALMTQLGKSLFNPEDGKPKYDNTRRVVQDIVSIINKTADQLTDLEKRTNKLRQELPIVQSFQLFIREASELFGKFCTAVVNLFMKIAPNEEARKAKASMLTHFDKLQESVNKHNSDIETKEFRHKPDASRESGFDIRIE